MTAAIRDFGERGRAGVSVRDIAKEAGVTLATVHHYFGSKEDLFLSCLDACYSRLQGLQAELLEVLSTVTPAPQRDVLIEMTIRTCFGFALRHREESRFLLRSTLFEPDSAHRDKVEASQRRYLDSVSEILGPLLNRKPADLRVPLQGLMFILTRMAVSRDAELEIIGGDVDRTREAFERYVVDIALHTMLPDTEPLRRTASRKNKGHKHAQ